MLYAFCRRKQDIYSISQVCSVWLDKVADLRASFCRDCIVYHSRLLLSQAPNKLRLPFIMAHETREPIPSPAQGVGPTYRREDEKPTATVSKELPYENVHVLPQTPQLIALLT